jgi:outer membrane PBP1 activator LpoA protein
MLLAVTLALGAGLLTPPATVAADDATVAAESLSRSGQHAEAARSYERQAKRLFRAWDTRLTLLAAREYLAAGQTADAERMLGKVGGRAGGDDAILLARIQAELALANSNGPAALAALGSIPKPWPAPLETELLLLEAQADFMSGRTLDGIHALEQRGRLLGAADARDVNYRLLLDALQRSGAAAAVPPGATDSDRAWIELAQLRAADAAGDTAAASRAVDWSTRHPNHPGSSLLPQAAPGAVAKGPQVLPVDASKRPG